MVGCLLLLMLAVALPIAVIAARSALKGMAKPARSRIPLGASPLISVSPTGMDLTYHTGQLPSRHEPPNHR